MLGWATWAVWARRGCRQAAWHARALLPCLLPACQLAVLVVQNWLFSLDCRAANLCCADTALVVGGQHYADWLSSTLWLYNATEDTWVRVGHAPLYSRGHVCGLHDGHLFLVLGQHGQGAHVAGLPSLVWLPPHVSASLLNVITVIFSSE